MLLFRTPSKPSQKTEAAKSLSSSDDSSSDDDDNDENLKKKTFETSSRSPAQADVPASEAATAKVEDHFVAKPNGDQRVGYGHGGNDPPKLSVEDKNSASTTIKIVRNPRAMTKETNKKLADEKINAVNQQNNGATPKKRLSVEDQMSLKKRQDVDVEMPNFRMAHAATVNVHGPGKKPKKSRNSTKGDERLNQEIVENVQPQIEEDFNVDLALFSPDYKPPPPKVEAVTSKTPPNKKLSTSSNKKKPVKKTSDSPLPGKLTLEEENILEAAEKEAEKRRQDEKENKRRKREEVERRRNEEEKIAREKIAKSRELKKVPEKAARAIKPSANVEQTESLRHQLKNLMSHQVMVEQTPATTATATSGVHLEIDSDEDDSLLLGRNRKSSLSSSSSSSSSDDDFEILKKSKTVPPLTTTTTSQSVMESGKGFCFLK
jgi:hypothetical protein